MIEALRHHINSNFEFLNTSKLLLAISGGIDSVVLAHTCHKLGLHFALAHCNFNLRGEESDADEDFVLQLADNLGLEVFVESFDTEAYAKEKKRSIQMAARELRYNWFEELADQLHFDYILTAHHADDNLETFLINFTRGTGLEGLTGIPPINGKFVRPLLPFSRADVEAYAQENKVKWRDDSSNVSVKYLRNKLRHEVIPILKEINPSLLQSFESTLSNLKDVADIVEDKMSDLIKEGVIKLTDFGCRLDIKKIKKHRNVKAYLYRFLNDYGFKEWNDVVSLLDAQSGKQVFSSDWRLIKHRDYLLLSELNTKEDEDIIIFKEDKQIETGIGTLVFEKTNQLNETHSNVIFVDENHLRFPLILRKWQEGDMFYPLGMHGKKKLSKYFKDEKLSMLDKENSWLLCSGNEIVWVIGRRADNRFKVTESTKNILKIELR